jgi:glycosyltransferase involved in cell wall biosynthesis
MKVLMLHNRYLVSGGEDHATAADVALLREHGHQVTLLEQDNTAITALGKTRTAIGTLWSSRSRARVEKELHTGDYDILHVQNFFPLWSPSVYYAASRCGIPVVQTLHNYRLFCINSFLFRDGHVCEDCLGRAMPWPGIVHRCYRDSRAGSSVVAAMIGLHNMMGTWSSKVHRYIAVSEFARDKFISAGLPPEKIAVKPNFLHPRPSPGTGGGGYVLYVGRLSPEKGIATMLDAWKTASNPLPLKVVGDGPLKDLVIAANKSTPSVEYLGSKSPAEVMDLMRQADLLVFPSIWQETMGRTVMEAFAVGTSVLASAIGPMLSMVVPAKNGFHFTPGDAGALREQVEWCSRNLEQVRGLRRGALASFDEKYTGAFSARMLFSIYRQAQAARG